jgi:protein-disulfide isomerase
LRQAERGESVIASAPREIKEEVSMSRLNRVTGRSAFARRSAGLLAVLLATVLLQPACGRGSREKGEAQTPPPGRVALDADAREVAKTIQANMQDFLVTSKVPTSAKVKLNWVRKAPYEGMYEANFAVELGGRVGRKSYFFDRTAKHFVLGPVYTVGEIYRRRVDTRNMVLVDRASRGPATAPITIAEYSDFQCPFCAAASLTIRALMKKYKGKVRHVFKHMPLTELHPLAYRAALVAECAGAQKRDAFWHFHDYFFDPSHHLTPENFKEKTRAFAGTLGLDVARLNVCVDKKEPKALINYDLNEAINYGFTSTPTFVINGVVLMGNQPYGVFEEIIQEELQKAHLMPG